MYVFLCREGCRHICSSIVAPFRLNFGAPWTTFAAKMRSRKGTNKNDVKKHLGHPSTVGTFDDTIWIYIERTKTKGKLLKLGKNITNKNNVLALKFNEYGILTEKNFYDKTKLKNIDFEEKATGTIAREKNFVYSFLSSLRQKINKPVHSKK